MCLTWNPSGLPSDLFCASMSLESRNQMEVVLYIWLLDFKR